MTTWQTKNERARRSLPGGGAIKARGKAAASKTKDSLDTLYGKKLTNRVEEYAQLSYHVLAAHEDRIATMDKSVAGLDDAVASNSKRIETVEVRVDQLSATKGSGAARRATQGGSGTLSIGWRILIVGAAVAGVASLILQMV